MNVERTWCKKGLILKPDKSLSWMQSHAMLPAPLHIKDTLYRIYFAGRNSQNQSHVGYALVDIRKPDSILEISQNPVLSPGRLGTFDDNGVLPSCLIRNGKDIFMYYIGFKPGGTTRMDLFGGLAISDDDGHTFKRWSEAPIIERCRANPFINTAPWVVKDPQAEGWIMYYVAGTQWVHADLPRYNIQIAESNDGKEWVRHGKVAIDFAPGENALARPYVTYQNETWHMWFSSKGDYYLPREAISNDARTWERVNGPPVLTPTPDSADEEMICYPIVIEHEGLRVMYYNGNAYGRDGLCLAVYE